MDYKQALKALQTNGYIRKNRYGQTIICKDIPETGYEGNLDPRALAELQDRKKVAPPEAELSIEMLREQMGCPNDDVTHGTVQGVEKCIDTTDETVRVLCYGIETGKKKSVIVFFHGGGFIGGSLECVENPCKALAMYGDTVVISVAYALAPEHPFPKGFNNCFDVVRCVYENADEFGVDKNSIGVCGDSAGGNLAAACAVRDRDEQLGIIKFQGLIYPAVNIANIPSEEYTWEEADYDVRHNQELIWQFVKALRNPNEMMVANYLAGDVSLANNPYVSPMFAETSGLPTALIVSAEYDYLTVGAEAYGRKLSRAGVQVVNMTYRGTHHAFIDKIGLYPQAEDCMREIALHFRKIVG